MLQTGLRLLVDRAFPSEIVLHKQVGVLRTAQSLCCGVLLCDTDCSSGQGVYSSAEQGWASKRSDSA